MRIIGGEFRRRLLHGPPDGAQTRPLPDMVRESLFNLLRGHFEDQPVYDAFAGTGAFGLEAASRGAARVVLVERDRRMACVLQQNIDELRVSDRCEVFVGDALGAGALARCPAPVHVAFFDPPYDLERDPAGWSRIRHQVARVVERLDDDGYAVLRTPWPGVWHDEHGAHALDLTVHGGVGPETHPYGSTAIHLYMRARSLA